MKINRIICIISNSYKDFWFNNMPRGKKNECIAEYFQYFPDDPLENTILVLTKKNIYLLMIWIY